MCGMARSLLSRSDSFVKGKAEASNGQNVQVFHSGIVLRDVLDVVPLNCLRISVVQKIILGFSNNWKPNISSNLDVTVDFGAAI